jgi:hypothetical protein
VRGVEGAGGLLVQGRQSAAEDRLRPAPQQCRFQFRRLALPSADPDSAGRCGLQHQGDERRLQAVDLVQAVEQEEDFARRPLAGLAKGLEERSTPLRILGDEVEFVLELAEGLEELGAPSGQLERRRRGLSEGGVQV